MNNLVYKKIANWFETKNWKFLWSEKNHVFTWGVKTEHDSEPLNFLLHLDEEYYIVYAFSPALVVNSENTDIVLRFINEINTQMIFGAFEYLSKSSEIRFKLYVDCLKQAPSPAIIERSILLPAHMLIRYGKEISAVSKGKKTLEDALKVINEK